MALTEKQMKDALTPVGQGVRRGVGMTPEEKSLRRLATNKAAGRARCALAKAYPEDYRALYQLAVVTELAKVGLTK